MNQHLKKSGKAGNMYSILFTKSGPSLWKCLNQSGKISSFHVCKGIPTKKLYILLIGKFSFKEHFKERFFCGEPCTVILGPKNP